MQRISANRPHRKDAKTQLMKADVLINPFADQVEGLQPLKSALNFYGLPSFWDILISNPPYISPVAYWKSTTPSVRRFEPALALVPPGKVSMGDTAWGDLFYPRLLEIARDVEARIVLLEVADMEQALRVAQRAHDLKIFDGVEIWRDSPGQSPETPLEGAKVVILGAGHGRSVLCWRGIGASWLGKTMVTDAEKDAQRLLQSSTGRALESDTSQNNAPSMEPQFAWTNATEPGTRPFRSPYNYIYNYKGYDVAKFLDGTLTNRRPSLEARHNVLKHPDGTFQVKHLIRRVRHQQIRLPRNLIAKRRRLASKRFDYLLRGSKR